jgi:hypothetical protein
VREELTEETTTSKKANDEHDTNDCTDEIRSPITTDDLPSQQQTYAVLTMPMMLAMVDESAPLVVMVVSVMGVVGKSQAHTVHDGTKEGGEWKKPSHTANGQKMKMFQNADPDKRAGQANNQHD